MEAKLDALITQVESKGIFPPALKGKFTKLEKEARLYGQENLANKIAELKRKYSQYPQEKLKKTAAQDRKRPREEPPAETPSIFTARNLVVLGSVVGAIGQTYPAFTGAENPFQLAGAAVYTAAKAVIVAGPVLTGVAAAKWGWGQLESKEPQQKKGKE